MGRPNEGEDLEQLAAAEGEARAGGVAGHRGAGGAAETEAGEEDGENEGERIGRRAQQERQEARPEDFGAERAQAGEGEREKKSAVGAASRRRRNKRGRRGDGGRGRRGDGREGEGEKGDGEVERGGAPRGRHEIVDTQEVKTGKEAAGDGAGGVAAIKEAEPRDAARGGLDPARDGGEGGAHEHGRREEADGADKAAEHDAGPTVAGVGEVEASEGRHRVEDDEAGNGQTEFEQGVNAERVAGGGHEAREREAAEAHAAHEGAQQYGERNGGGADDELEELKPDQFVNQRGAAAADEEHEQQREQARRRGGGGRMAHRATGGRPRRKRQRWGMGERTRGVARRFGESGWAGDPTDREAARSFAMRAGRTSRAVP